MRECIAGRQQTELMQVEYNVQSPKRRLTNVMTKDRDHVREDAFVAMKGARLSLRSYARAIHAFRWPLHSLCTKDTEDGLLFF